MMTPKKLKKIIKTEVPFHELVKNSGIYEFHESGDLSIGVSYEEDEDGKERYIFNLFRQKNEYINISNIGFYHETISELVEAWNHLEKAV